MYALIFTQLLFLKREGYFFLKFFYFLFFWGHFILNMLDEIFSYCLALLHRPTSLLRGNSLFRTCLWTNLCKYIISQGYKDYIKKITDFFLVLNNRKNIRKEFISMEILIKYIYAIHSYWQYTGGHISNIQP